MWQRGGFSAVSVRLAGQALSVVRLLPACSVPAAAANGIGGALMLLSRHRWNIDAVSGAG